MEESELYMICEQCWITCDESDVDIRDGTPHCPNCGALAEDYFHPYDEDAFNEKYGD